MFQCFSTRQLGFFLALAVLLGTLLITVSRMGRALAVQEIPEDAVFLPVIMYHSITSPTNDYRLSPADLEQDLTYLREHGYESVSVSQLYAYTLGEGTLPAHPVLLTFDDGFYNNLSDALPLLEEYDMQAVVSVVGRYTEELAPADPHVPAYSYLTWEDIRALLESGRIELGSHTYDLHANDKRAGCSILLGEDADAYTLMLRRDLEQLQTRASEETGYTPAVFAYPYGYICRESIPVLKDLGFVCTLTCREEGNYITRDPSCLYALGRYHRSPAYSTEEFMEKALTP